ncbi:hypothetical protein V6N12_001064 [Hibiscus sabdariffa]|uniref:C2H2-type domain-containing protein n=1 Tax=Hibiscus sabdariffa TaxID=183260 RepID=A0ABR2C653_9ROSI
MKISFPSEIERNLSLANCLNLMLLSQGGINYDQHAMNNPSRVFECKTCNRRFASFQALGGHRASHKKPRIHHRASLGRTHEEAQDWFE